MALLSLTPGTRREKTPIISGDNQDMKLILGALLSSVVLCAAATPTVADARKFLDEANARLLQLTNDAGQASWVQSNFITDDTEAVAARANEKQIEAAVEL